MYGYVYALINPSLPGLVKIGRTSRDPDGRCAEISSATGVPTPFIVGYSAAVSDCEKAEQHIHEILTQKGFRVSNNREFFNATLQEIIKILIYIEELYPPGELENNVDNPDSSDVAIDQESLAENLVREGLEYVIGRNVFQDYLTAEKKFKAAARLGSIDAKNELIDLYRDEDGLYNPKEALKLSIEMYNTVRRSENYPSNLKQTYHYLHDIASICKTLDDPVNMKLAYQKLLSDETGIKECDQYHELVKNPKDAALRELTCNIYSGPNARGFMNCIYYYFCDYAQGEIEFIESLVAYELLPIIKLAKIDEYKYESINKYEVACSNKIKNLKCEERRWPLFSNMDLAMMLEVEGKHPFNSHLFELL